MKPAPEKKTRKPDSKDVKLPVLPKGSKIIKRPLAHRIGAPPSRTVYVSTKAPFMSIVKRVRKKLDHDAGGARLPSTRGLPFLAQMNNLHTRGSRMSTGTGTGRNNPTISGGQLGQEEDGRINSKSTRQGQDGEKQEVKAIATGKAIPKALEVAAWFARQSDCEVSIQSGSLSTVDEVQYPPGRRLGSSADVTGEDVDIEAGPEEGKEAEEEELDPYRSRTVTYIEVGVKYRA